MRSGWLEDTAHASVARVVGGLERPAQICRFLHRCPVSIGGVCDRLPPPRAQLSDGRQVLCHLPATHP
jgi:peptide/nickel transport system ATP-binding protein